MLGPRWTPLFPSVFCRDKGILTFLPESLAEDSIIPDWEVVFSRVKSEVVRAGLLGGNGEPHGRLKIKVEEPCEGRRGCCGFGNARTLTLLPALCDN